MAGRAESVKSHPFFRGVDWDDVYYRKYRGPIIPQLRHKADAQCFDDYPDEKAGRDPYTHELQKKWDHHFKDF